MPIVGPCLVQGTFHVTNAGSKPSPQSTFKIARSDNTTLGSGDPVLGTFTIGQLDAGASQDVSFSYVIPNGQYVIGQVDSNDDVLELNESNNVFYKGPLN